MKKTISLVSLVFALFISVSFSFVHAGECQMVGPEVSQCGEGGQSYSCNIGTPGAIDSNGPFTWFCAQCLDGNMDSWGENASGCCGDGCPISGGTVNVSANIAGASWTITGPDTLSGSGVSQSYPGEPTGTYTITWGAAAGYVTPSGQTLSIVSNGDTISFSGTYTPIPAVNLYFSYLERFVTSLFATN